MPIMQPSPVEGRPETLEKLPSWEATGGTQTHNLSPVVESFNH